MSYREERIKQLRQIQNNSVLPSTKMKCKHQIKELRKSNKRRAK